MSDYLCRCEDCGLLCSISVMEAVSTRTRRCRRCEEALAASDRPDLYDGGCPADSALDGHRPSTPAERRAMAAYAAPRQPGTLDLSA